MAWKLINALHNSSAEYNRFGKRIAGQPIGTMYAG